MRIDEPWVTSRPARSSACTPRGTGAGGVSAAMRPSGPITTSRDAGRVAPVGTEGVQLSV